MVSRIFIIFDFDRKMKMMEIVPIYSSTIGQMGIDGVLPPTMLIHLLNIVPLHLKINLNNKLLNNEH